MLVASGFLPGEIAVLALNGMRCPLTQVTLGVLAGSMLIAGAAIGVQHADEFRGCGRLEGGSRTVRGKGGSGQSVRRAGVRLRSGRSPA